MFTKLTPEAKLVVVISAVVAAFFIGPIVTGLIVLLATGITFAPWPAVAVVCMAWLISSSWLILWKRLKSDFLFGKDILVTVGLTFALLTQLSDNPQTVFNWAMMIYVVALLETILHALVALSVSLGVNPQTQLESEPATA